MSSIPLDVVRTQYVPGQYGIGSIWLDQLWSPRLPGSPAVRYGDQERWVNSTEYHAAWRNYMALVLLHDAIPWSLAPVQKRQEVALVLDEFEVAHATFSGYWEHPVLINERDGFVASVYRHTKFEKVLLVAVNTKELAGSFVLSQPCHVFQGTCPSALRFRVHGAGEWNSLSEEHLDVRIPARDFRLIELATFEQAGRPALR